MFYRRKIVLALMEALPGEMEKIRLHKLLFLFGQGKQDAEYDFIPYKFGSYSYSLAADLHAMEGRGILTGTSTNYTAVNAKGYLATLKEPDRQLILRVVNAYGKMTNHQLMKHTYINFPYYAIHSEVAGNILDATQLNAVHASKPTNSGMVLYTIGYEGVSIEAYLNKLLAQDVKMLVDVRDRPQSMKFGFSKKRLAAYCESVGIQYRHFHEVGIVPEKRRTLATQSDYDALFEEYRKNNLPRTTTTQLEIRELLKEHERIALTCFEAHECQCHRKPLAESIASLNGSNYTIEHL